MHRFALLLCFLLAGCDTRPELNVMPGVEAPPPPSDAAFAHLPSWREVRDYLQITYRYWQPDTLEVARTLTGNVVWQAQEHRWTYQPASKIIASAATRIFPKAEMKRLNSVRWYFADNKWQPDQLFINTPTLYRGIDDPSEAQVVALLQMPGIQYGLHRLAEVPRKIELLAPPRFQRDEEGFAPPVIAVDFSAEAELIDWSSESLVTHRVVMRARVICNVRDDRWTTNREIELVSATPLHSRTMSRDALYERQWAMDRWWRNH